MTGGTVVAAARCGEVDSYLVRCRWSEEVIDHQVAATGSGQRGEYQRDIADIGHIGTGEISGLQRIVHRYGIE